MRQCAESYQRQMKPNSIKDDGKTYFVFNETGISALTFGVSVSNTFN